MATRSKADPVTETNYKFDLDLPESDVRELMAGRVPQSVKDVIAPMVAWQDDGHPISQAYGRRELARVDKGTLSDGQDLPQRATS